MEQGLYEKRGRIFDIQRYSIHDGPGIRTIVFLKGCVLRCRWCCNPESQEYAIQTVSIDGKKKTYGEDVTVGEVLSRVMKDRDYYRRSGGGLTLSGGESLCQAEFATALLMGAKEYGISTAMESTACAPYEAIEGLLPYLDHYLLDIKHVNSDKHKEFTGKGNELILENAKRIAKSGLTDLTVRVPVIPTFNSSEGDIAAIARFAASLPGVNRIHLLPYHRLGMDKYVRLGREYLMGGIAPPSDEHMLRLRAAVERETDLLCQIGG